MLEESDAGLAGRQGPERVYTPSHLGGTVYKLLRDVRKEGIIPALRTAVDDAILPGT